VHIPPEVALSRSRAGTRDRVLVPTGVRTQRSDDVRGRHQTLRVPDGSYVLDRPADVTEVIPRADVLAVVFGPDGSTVMRRDDTGEDAWSALWNGDEAHDVQATGMLSAIVAPLAAGGVPVRVVSSYDGDLVLVPTDRLDEASEVLQAAGHQVRR